MQAYEKIKAIAEAVAVGEYGYHSMDDVNVANTGGFPLMALLQILFR